jgi:hypothetical protein
MRLAGQRLPPALFTHAQTFGWGGQAVASQTKEAEPLSLVETVAPESAPRLRRKALALTALQMARKCK